MAFDSSSSASSTVGYCKPKKGGRRSHCDQYDNFCPIIGQPPCGAAVCRPRCEIACGKFSCCECGHEGDIKVKIPVPAPSYFIARLTGSIVLVDGAPTPIPYNLTVLKSDCLTYNAQTGAVTVIACADGIYNINIHTSITAPLAGSAVVALTVAGVTITQTIIYSVAGIPADQGLSIDYPLYGGQIVTVVVTGTGSVTVTPIATNFSMVRVSKL